MKRVVLAVLLVGCGSVDGNQKIDARPADSKVIDAAPDASTRRCDPAKPFDAPIVLDELNSTADDAWPVLSPDELTVYFHTLRGGAGTMGSYDIFVSTRASIDAPFGTPAPMAGVNTTGADECASITGDGLFFFVDHYNAGVTNWDIYMAQRGNTTVDFPAPTSVPSLNQTTAAEDDNQYVLPDNSAMYFLSDRGGTRDIYRAKRNVGGTWDTPVDVLPMPTVSEQAMAVTPDELTMYVTSDQTPTTGSNDIWVTHRTTVADGWGQTMHVDELSTAASEVATWISADGCDIYLYRNVPGRSGDIFWARKPM